MQMSKVSGRVKSFVTKTHYLQMRNLYCQRNICESERRGEYINAMRSAAEVQSLGHSTAKGPQRGLALSPPALLQSRCQKVRLRGSDCKTVKPVWGTVRYF